MVKKQRLEEVQVLRGLAFLAVVLQHSIGHYAYLPETRPADGVLLLLFLLMSKYAVPVFIFISGLVLFYQYDRDSSLAYGSFLKKRFVDIVAPYLLFTVLYAIVQNGWSVLLDPIQLLHYELTGKASYHLWYIVMIIPIYLLFPFIRTFTVRIAAWTIWAKPSVIILVWTLLTIGYVWLTGLDQLIAGAMSQMDIPLFTLWFTEYADRNPLYFFFYFMLGALAGWNADRWRGWMMRYGGWFAAIWTVLAFPLMYRTLNEYRWLPEFQANLHGTSLIDPYMSLFLIAFLPVIYRFALGICSSSSTLPTTALSYLGQYSYIAYLVHALLLVPGELVADYLLPSDLISTRTVVAFAIATVLSVSFAHIVDLPRQILRTRKQQRAQ